MTTVTLRIVSAATLKGLSWRRGEGHPVEIKLRVVSYLYKPLKLSLLEGTTVKL